MMKLEELRKQIAFIAETDKLKSVLRRTSPIGLERRENSAEHSWQVILSALMFAEHANTEIDLLKVVKMLAIHDVVEIDAGDTFHYDKSNTQGLYEKEHNAAKRVLGYLPEEQAQAYLALWEEFEARETPEAKYAAAVDRIMAFIMNSNNQGGNWIPNNITIEKALQKNAHMQEGSEALWAVAQEILQSCRDKGFIKSNAEIAS